MIAIDERGDPILDSEGRAIDIAATVDELHEKVRDIPGVAESLKASFEQNVERLRKAKREGVPIVKVGEDFNKVEFRRATLRERDAEVDAHDDPHPTAVVDGIGGFFC